MNQEQDYTSSNTICLIQWQQRLTHNDGRSLCDTVALPPRRSHTHVDSTDSRNKSKKTHQHIRHQPLTYKLY